MGAVYETDRGRIYKGEGLHIFLEAKICELARNKAAA